MTRNGEKTKRLYIVRQYLRSLDFNLAMLTLKFKKSISLQTSSFVQSQSVIT